jgi:hypothetical protein
MENIRGFFDRLFKCGVMKTNKTADVPLEKPVDEINKNVIQANLPQEDSLNNITSQTFERPTDNFDININPPQIPSYNILQEAYNSNISNSSEPRYNLIYSVGGCNYLKSDSPRRSTNLEFIKRHITENTDNPKRTNIEFIKRHNTEGFKKYDLEIPKDHKERPKSSNTTMERYKFLEANIIDPDGIQSDCIILEHDIDEHITEIEDTLKQLKNSYEKKIYILEKNNIELQKENDILQNEMFKLKTEFLHMVGCC